MGATAERATPRPAPRGPDAGTCVRLLRLPGSQCGPSVTPLVAQAHPVPFHPRAAHTWSPWPRGWGRPGKAWGGGPPRALQAGNGSRGPPSQRPPGRAPAQGPGARAARRITPPAAARRVPGRSPDAHWPGRRSQAVSPCGVSARGRPRLNRVGAGLEGARETAAVRLPLLLGAPSSLSAARPHCRPRPDQVPAEGRVAALADRAGFGAGATRPGPGVAASPHPPASESARSARGEGSPQEAARVPRPEPPSVGRATAELPGPGGEGPARRAPGSVGQVGDGEGRTPGRAANSHFGLEVGRGPVRAPAARCAPGLSAHKGLHAGRAAGPLHLWHPAPPTAGKPRLGPTQGAFSANWRARKKGGR